MTLFRFVPAIIAGLLAATSIPLLYLPIRKAELSLRQKLHISALRHWMSRHETEKWTQKSTIQNAVELSRKNIAWHGILTFAFSTVMVQAQSTDSLLFQYGSQLMLVTSIAYFLGSIVQRQKMAILSIRRLN